MAKPTKSEQSDRRKVVDNIRRKQKRADKRQGRVILGVCILVALVIVGAAAYNPVKTAFEKARYSGKSLDEIGATASACQKIFEKDATGSGEHVQEDVQIKYPDAPPAFGKHWNVNGVAPVPQAQRYYTADTRPELEALVHNLEHGYTLLWYDKSVAKDAGQIAAIKAMADTLDANDTNGRLKFKAVPWTDTDAKEAGGKNFPKGQHIALTHWRVDPKTQKQHGAWQYCSEPSGEALSDFMKKYPFTDAPEPFAM
ncbi:MAG: DUF3105 domain-containing protein [Nocardioidaceae bacterium]|nr:DUF3105 domain-containing protein [Nocardioidaceae bacterium]